MAFQRAGMTTNTQNTAAAPRAAQTAPRSNQQAMAPVQDTSVTYTANGEEVSLSFQDVRKFICENATDAECKIFIETCRGNGLNPFLREAHLIKYDAKSAASIVVGKNAFTKRAEMHPQFDGYEAGLVVLVNGKIEYREGSAVYEGEELLGGWAKVYRKDRTRPSFDEVNLNEYIQTKTDKNGNVVPNSMWASKPGTMIRKVALVHALREAFPSALGAIYSEEEVNVDVEGSFRELPNEEPSAPARLGRSRRAPKSLPSEPIAADDPFAQPVTEPETVPVGGEQA